jgi:starvation-inducible DNA-binding protein
MPTTQTRIRTSHGLAPEIREKAAQLLNQTLADTFDLISQTKQAHWNVKGANFHQLHLLFDTLAEGLQNHLDTVAERITALGHYAQGTVRNAAQASRLEEYPAAILAGSDHLEALSARFSQYGNFVRQAIDTTAEWGDASTADLYTAISRDADQWLWFLEAHLQD